MKTVISFSEGCSGHFLAALLANSDITIDSRIDTANNAQLWKDHSIHQAFRSNFQPHQDDYTIALTHEKNYNLIQYYLNPDRVIRIEPVTGIFTAIYNVYHKKLINEDHPTILDNWQANPSAHYNRAHEHLKDYYTYFSNSAWTPAEIFFDFGWLYNDAKLKQFAQDIDVDINLDMVYNYRAKQLPWVLNHPSATNMAEIVDQFPAEIFYTSPWFASYCIFSFEHANNMQESQRTWSIDNVGLLTRDELIHLSTGYQL